MRQERTVKTFVLSLFLLGLFSVRALADGFSPLTIESRKGGAHDFMVELALTDETRALGLMYRTELAPDKGMLFVFDGVDTRSFWMKNTLIPLDMIFIGADGHIINIVANAEPETLTPRKSRGKAKAVLELAGGRAAELGIRPGDLVRHRLLGIGAGK